MRKLLISTTALSVALSPFSTFPSFAQTVAEDGSVIGPDGSVLCVPTADAPCDLDAIMAILKDAEAAAAAEAAAQAEAAAAAQAEADAAAAAQAEADAAAAAAQAEADAAAAAQAEADAAAAAQAEADAAAAAQAEADAAAAAAQAETDAVAAAQAEADAAAAAQAEADAAAAAQAEADAAAAAQAEADAAAAAQAEADAAAAAQAEADAAAAAQAEADAAAAAQEPVAEEPVAEEPVAEEPVAEEPVTEEPVTEEPVTEEPVAEAPVAEDPAVLAAEAEALAAAEAELAITDDGTVADPAAGLKTAEVDPSVAEEPVDAPVISETEVETLTELLTADPALVDATALGAAETLAEAPPAEGTSLLETAAPADAVSAVTEVLTEDSRRTSAEEFAAAPVALASGKKNKLSDLEKAGLIVLGALVVGAIIKNNRINNSVNEGPVGDSRVVSNTGDRVIVLKPDGTYQVYRDDDSIIRQPGSTVRTETYRDGSTRTIVERADGTQVVTIRDATGRVLRRAQYDRLGREMILIDDLAEEEVVVIRDLPKPKKRIVISSKDNDAALKRELAALEADKAGRKFSLRQIREIPEVRALAATIDVESVTFASGSAAIAAAEARNLADLGRVMQDLLDENPGEMFLIEGHTDATGKAAMNLALSDRRAESVALALTEYFDIPPENMVIQGYGETELLIDTQANEPLNRRVEVRVITPLLRNVARN